MSAAEFLVSSRGRMSVPAAVRHRWGLDGGGRVTVVDLGDAIVVLPPGARQRLLDEALPAAEHLRRVAALDDPDLGHHLSGRRRRRPPAADLLAGRRAADLEGLSPRWGGHHRAVAFPLRSSLADPAGVGKLSAPVAALGAELRAALVAQLVELPDTVEIVPSRTLAWPMAQLRHRAAQEAQVLNEQLNHALDSRVVIEQAKGMVAERVGLDMEQAFSKLRSHARDHNLRLVDVGTGVIAGTLAASALDRLPTTRPS